MLITTEYVKQSLGLHLFFTRIMKEHAFFLEIGFTPRDKKYIETANQFRMVFDEFLKEVIKLSTNVISSEFLDSGEVITPYTLAAEELSEYYTGIQINTDLTKMEANLAEGTSQNIHDIENELVKPVYVLNNRILAYLDALLGFEISILRNVVACKMFTVNYPLTVDHIIRETELYQLSIKRLQDKEEISLEAYEEEMFWNNNMAEHSLFTRGLLDPTEYDDIIKANNFANEFNQLYENAKSAMEQSTALSKVTSDSLAATIEISNFNAASTEGLINCKVKSIIIPLLSDHNLREANHYIRLLRKYSI